LVEKLESKKVEFQSIRDIFEDLIKKLEEQYEASEASFDKERDALLAYLGDTKFIDTTDEDEGEKREREREQRKDHEKEVEIRVESRRRAKRLEIKESITLTWILYMRISRRSDVILFLV
jgi:hypothetical protein